MDSSSIREARVDDVPDVVDMIRAGSEEGMFHSQDLSLEEQRKSFRKYAFEERSTGYQFLVCQVGGIIVGYIDYRVRRGVGHILGIYVKQSYRRKGFGKQLMEKALVEFRKKGCHKTRLEVFAHNEPAIEFYRHLGFDQEAFLPKDEEKKDTMILSKFFHKS